MSQLQEIYCNLLGLGEVARDAARGSFDERQDHKLCRLLCAWWRGNSSVWRFQEKKHLSVSPQAELLYEYSSIEGEIANLWALDTLSVDTVIYI
jgi:hypothetical protein